MIEGIKEIIDSRSKDFTKEEKERLNIFCSKEGLKTKFSEEEWEKFEPILREIMSFLEEKKNSCDKRIAELEAMLS